jgi:iron complex transport system ATP-binding protein
VRLDVTGLDVTLDGTGILRAAGLTVAAGTVVGLVGPNGSGKSTLLRTVYRVLRPSAGRVILGGDDVWRLTARQSAQRTAAVVQEPTAGFDYTVGETVAMGLDPHRPAVARDAPGEAAAVGDALTRVGLPGLEPRLLATLSGGERQRVLVARALVQRPRLLVLDEPTNHLDIRHQLDLLALVRGLGVTTLTSLHDLNLAAAYCDRLVVLSSGRVVTTGPPGDALTPDLLAEVFGVAAARTVHPVTGRLHLLFSPLP